MNIFKMIRLTDITITLDDLLKEAEFVQKKFILAKENPSATDILKQKVHDVFGANNGNVGQDILVTANAITIKNAIFGHLSHDMVEEGTLEDFKKDQKKIYADFLIKALCYSGRKEEPGARIEETTKRFSDALRVINQYKSAFLFTNHEKYLYGRDSGLVIRIFGDSDDLWRSYSRSGKKDFYFGILFGLVCLDGEDIDNYDEEKISEIARSEYDELVAQSGLRINFLLDEEFTNTVMETGLSEKDLSRMVGGIRISYKPADIKNAHNAIKQIKEERGIDGAAAVLSYVSYLSSIFSKEGIPKELITDKRHLLNVAYHCTLNENKPFMETSFKDALEIAYRTPGNQGEADVIKILAEKAAMRKGFDREIGTEKMHKFIKKIEECRYLHGYHVGGFPMTSSAHRHEHRLKYAKEL